MIRIVEACLFCRPAAYPSRTDFWIQLRAGDGLFESYEYGVCSAGNAQGEDWESQVQAVLDSALDDVRYAEFWRDP